MDPRQVAALGEQLRMLASLVLGRKIYESEDMEIVNAELRARYNKLPERRPGQGGRIV